MCRPRQRLSEREPSEGVTLYVAETDSDRDAISVCFSEPVSLVFRRIAYILSLPCYPQSLPCHVNYNTIYHIIMEIAKRNVT